MFYTPFVLIVLEYNLIIELQSYLNNSINYKIMNINKFTIKSQEAIQLSQQLAQGFGQQQIENEHVFKAIFDVMKMWPHFLKN
jgi:hypothetical protein